MAGGRGRPQKEFHEYLIDSSMKNPTHDHYNKSPAAAFLKYTVEAKSAIAHCIKHFPKKNDGTYTKDSIDSLEQLIVGVLPSIMGHFETYQKHLFASMFDNSVYLKGFNVEKFLKDLSKIDGFEIDIVRLAAYRGCGASSVGLLIADSISGWHNPSKVNSYFNCYNFKFDFFEKGDISSFNVLWQLRHSIVHTGGTLTLADSQKIRELNNNGNSKIAFAELFTFEVARKMHKYVKRSAEGIGNCYLNRLKDDTPTDEREKIEKLFQVKSSVNSWLR